MRRIYYDDVLPLQLTVCQTMVKTMVICKKVKDCRTAIEIEIIPPLRQSLGEEKFHNFPAASAKVLETIDSVKSLVNIF